MIKYCLLLVILIFFKCNEDEKYKYLKDKTYKIEHLFFEKTLLNEK